MTEIQLQLIAAISKAVKDLNASELIFEYEWIYLHPGQSLRIGEEMLHVNYDIPTGFDGYGMSD